MGEQWCFRNVPFYERWHRFGHLRHVVDFYTDVLTSGSEANKNLQESLTEYIKDEVNNDPELVEKMVPSHPPICTRMLVDNNWCKMMLEKDKVTLLQGRAKQITEDTVIGQNGEVAKADIIIYATGFQSTRFCTESMQVWQRWCVFAGGLGLRADSLPGHDTAQLSELLHDLWTQHECKLRRQHYLVRGDCW